MLRHHRDAHRIISPQGDVDEAAPALLTASAGASGPESAWSTAHDASRKPRVMDERSCRLSSAIRIRPRRKPSGDRASTVARVLFEARRPGGSGGQDETDSLVTPASLSRASALWCAILAGPLLAAAASAQAGARRDTVRRLDTSAVRLAPIAVDGSIAALAGPTVTSAVPALVQFIDGDVMRRWHPRTAADALANQGGFSAYDDLGSPYKLTVAARGFSVGSTVGSPAGLSVFIDGVRQNEPDAQEVNFELLPLEYVDHIELMTGPASLLGPNSLGGAVNFITRRGVGPAGGDIETTVGSFGARSIRAAVDGATGDGVDYFAGADAGGERGWRQVTGSRTSHAFINLGRHMASAGLRLEGMAVSSRVETAGSLPQTLFDVAPRTNFTAGDVDALDELQLSIGGYANALGHPVTATAYVRRSAGDRFNANQPPDDNVRGRTAASTVGVETELRFTPALRGHQIRIRTGVDAAANRVDARIFAEPQAGSGTDSLTTHVTSASHDIAVYSVADARIGRATVSAGARYDVIDVPFRDEIHTGATVPNAFRHLSPRAGISYDAGHGGQLYGSAGQSFRAPAILELGCADPAASCPLPVALSADPPLAPVRATTYEVGGRLARSSALLTAALYRTGVRDEIFFIASGSGLLSGYFTNIARTRRQGADLSGEWTVMNGRVSGHLIYTFTQATFVSASRIFSARSDSAFTGSPFAGPNAVRNGDQIPLNPVHQLRAGADGQLGHGLSVGLEGRYVGRQWPHGDEANETAPLAPYTVVNGRASFDWSGWSVSTSVANVLDSRAATFATFNENLASHALERFLTPLNGRTVSVGVERRFGK